MMRRCSPMTRIDEELERRFSEGQGRVGHPSVPDLRRRAVRRERARRLGTSIGATCAVFVIVGVVVWARVSIGPAVPVGPRLTAPSSPLPIVPARNGIIAFADGADLFTIDPATGHQETIGGTPTGIWFPAWSPDGTLLAVTAFPSDGPRELFLLQQPDGPRLLAQADNVGAPSWSPDGKSIAYVGADAQGSAIHIVSLASG